MRPHVLALVATAALAAAPPALAHSRYTPPPEGRVTVTNRSGGTVTVQLGAEPPMTLPAYQTATLHAPAGDALLRATYKQFGATRVLESEHVYVDPYRAGYVVLDPEDQARVLVTNDTPFTATLEVNDRYYDTLDPHEVRVVTVHVGTVYLDLLAEGGRLAEHTRIDARPFAEPRWTVHRELTGTLVARNPFPERIELVDERGAVRTVDAYGTAVYGDLPAGPFRLTARRVTDEPIDTEYTTIVAGRTTEWRPDPPREGLVSIDNDHGRAVRFVVDGDTVRTLRPDEDARLTVGVGWHRVAARDDAGRLLVDTWIEVKPFDVARVSFGDPGDDYVADARDRDDRDDRDEHDHDRDEHESADHCDYHR